MTGALLQQQATRRLPPGPIPFPTGLAPGADLSNHQGENIGYLLDPNPQWEYVVLRARAPGEPAYFTPLMLSQVQQVVASGKAWDPYDWGYGSADPKRTAADTAALALGAGAWGIQHLDCETYTDPITGQIIDAGPTKAAWIWDWIREVESYRLTPSIYTGAWWVIDHFEGGQVAFSQFADRCLLWWSNYPAPGQHMTWETVPLPLGWSREQLIGWQYVGNPIDLDWWSRPLLHRHRRKAA